MKTESSSIEADRADDGQGAGSTSTVCGHSPETYVRMVTSFHGQPAPGLLVGGRMVDLAVRRLPGGILFDAVCETRNCLPDAIQLLTPCTICNGWLRVLDWGRYALTLFDKSNGEGVRKIQRARFLCSIRQSKLTRAKIPPDFY